MKAGYVRNIKENPRVRVKLREGFGAHWHTGTAQLLWDDDGISNILLSAIRCVFRLVYSH